MRFRRSINLWVLIQFVISATQNKMFGIRFVYVLLAVLLTIAMLVLNNAGVAASPIVGGVPTKKLNGTSEI